MTLNSMNLDDIPMDSIVCFRYVNDPRWILFSRWTDEIRRDYEYSHSKPSNHQKYNREPIFPDAVYVHVKVDDQTISKLKQLYLGEDKKPFRTKIYEHDIFCILEP